MDGQNKTHVRIFPKDVPVVGGVTLDGLGLDRRLRHDPPVLV